MKNHKDFLNEQVGYNKLEKIQKIKVEQNLNELVGSINFYIDKRLEKDDHFDLLSYLKNILEVNDLPLNLDTNNVYINYKSDYLKNYTVKNIKITNRLINIKFMDISQEFETQILDNTNIKSIVILSNEDKNVKNNILNVFTNLNNDQNELFFISIDRNETVIEGLEEYSLQVQGIPYEFNKEHWYYAQLFVRDEEPLYKENIQKQIKEHIEVLNKLLGDKRNYYNYLYQQLGEIKKKKIEAIEIINSFKNEIDQLINKISYQLQNKDIILKEIQKNDVERKKQSQKYFFEKLFETKGEEINLLVEQKVNQFNSLLGDLINELEHSYKKYTGFSIGTNMASWFKSGLVGLGTYGALTAYMSSLGNLGGYILVAKGVSALSTFGISVGSTAAVISRVSFFGGPVGIVIGTALTTALLSKSLLGLGWKSELASKIKKIARKNFIPQYEYNNFVLWDIETKEALDKGFEGMIEKLCEEFNTMYDLNDQEMKKIDDRINSIKRL